MQTAMKTWPEVGIFQTLLKTCLFLSLALLEIYHHVLSWQEVKGNLQDLGCRWQIKLTEALTLPCSIQNETFFSTC